MDAATISSAILKVTDKIDSIIQAVKPLAEKSVTDFVGQHVKKLALIGTYANFFRELDVSERCEAEKAWERVLIRDTKVEETVDLLLDKEEEFDNLLQFLDQKWKIEKNTKREDGGTRADVIRKPLEVGDLFPKYIKMKNTENK